MGYSSCFKNICSSLCTVGGDVNWYSHYEKPYKTSLKKFKRLLSRCVCFKIPIEMQFVFVVVLGGVGGLQLGSKSSSSPWDEGSYLKKKKWSLRQWGLLFSALLPLGGTELIPLSPAQGHSDGTGVVNPNIYIYPLTLSMPIKATSSGIKKKKKKDWSNMATLKGNTNET